MSPVLDAQNRGRYVVWATVIPVEKAVELLVDSICEAMENSGEDAEACRLDFAPWPPTDFEDDDLVLFIDKLAFNEARRGKGWGRRFVASIERWGRQHGAIGAMLHAGALWGAWDTSDLFWSKMGYSQYASWDDAMAFWKDL